MPVDLARVVRLLRHELGDRAPVGHVVGKTTMRDTLVDAVGCSYLQAERLVDQLERSGYLRLVRPPRRGAMRSSPPRWVIDSSARRPR